MENNKTLGMVAAALFLVTQSASAIPVQWTLNGWNLTGGETVTGTFVYDADLGTFSNVNISSTLGPELFTFVGSGANSNTLEFVTGEPGSVNLADTSVVLASIGGGGMTNAGGGPLSVLTQGGTNLDSSQAICGDGDCSSFQSPFVFLTAGNITGTVVPVPAAVWLFGSGLLGLVGMARRKKAA